MLVLDYKLDSRISDSIGSDGDSETDETLVLRGYLTPRQRRSQSRWDRRGFEDRRVAPWKNGRFRKNWTSKCTVIGGLGA